MLNYLCANASKFSGRLAEEIKGGFMDVYVELSDGETLQDFTTPAYFIVCSTL